MEPKFGFLVGSLLSKNFSSLHCRRRRRNLFSGLVNITTVHLG